MQETPFPKVRIRGTNLVGTRAIFNEEERPYRTSEGHVRAVEVYFPDTGEIRRFNDEMLEEVPDSE